MNFTAPAFVLGLPLVVLLHRLLPPRARWVLLLAASLGFTRSAVRRPCRCWRVLRWAPTPQRWPSATVKAGSAESFGFAVRQYLSWLPWRFQIRRSFRHRDLALLPAGISFYTFQTLGYVIDVYRGRLAPERHLGYYALFVSFFPQLVVSPLSAAPIFAAAARPCPPDRTAGMAVYPARFLQKAAAGRHGSGLYRHRLRSPRRSVRPAAILATVLFAGQIYWDFSGYSDIAVGAAALLGVRLSRNFDHPYQAVSLRFLAPVAYQPDPLVYRLSLHSAGRFAVRRCALCAEHADGLSFERSVARCFAAFCGLGRCPRSAAARREAAFPR